MTSSAIWSWMMNDAGPSCIADTQGLLDIAQQKSGNLKKTLLDDLASGTIGVPACAWAEFKELYPDEATELDPYIPEKIAMRKRAYMAKAGMIADQLNNGFSRGPYDDGNDIHVAAIACVDRVTILTSKDQIAIFQAMGCTATDLETWLQV